jgi:hypothetical protein
MGHAELAALAGGPVGLLISGDAAGERLLTSVLDISIMMVWRSIPSYLR